MLHGLSFDIEDYYQIIYRDYFQMEGVPGAEVERNTHWILDTLIETGISATFFLLAMLLANSLPWSNVLFMKDMRSLSTAMITAWYLPCSRQISALPSQELRRKLNNVRALKQ